MVRIRLPVQSGFKFGFKMAGVGIVPSHSDIHSNMSWTGDQSKNVSRSVDFRMPPSVSNAHEGFVHLRRDNLPRYLGNLTQFCAGSLRCEAYYKAVSNR